MIQMVWMVRGRRQRVRLADPVWLSLMYIRLVD